MNSEAVESGMKQLDRLADYLEKGESKEASGNQVPFMVLLVGGINLDHKIDEGGFDGHGVQLRGDKEDDPDLRA